MRYALICLLVFSSTECGFAQDQPDASASRMAAAATRMLSVLSPAEKEKASFTFDDPERLNWHFIPRDRRGVSLRELQGESHLVAKSLVSSGLSGEGFEKLLKVMSLEEVLYLLEGGDEAKRRERRHPHKYFISIFGTPGATGRWGWRFEGHHISLNYVIEDGRFVSSTPEFLGANPGKIDAGPGRLLRVLGEREDLGREILRQCTPEQRAICLIASEPPREIRTPGKLQPQVGAPEGLPFAKMNSRQQETMRKLLRTYLVTAPPEVMRRRLRDIERSGMDGIHFAWWGGAELNQPHHYRIQGATFIIEYNNVQNDANHVHSIWRNVAGDFGIPRK